MSSAGVPTDDAGRKFQNAHILAREAKTMQISRGRRLQGKLRLRVEESCKRGFSTVEEIVADLISSHSDYSGMKKKTLTMNVHKALASQRGSESKRKKKQQQVKPSSPSTPIQGQEDYDEEEEHVDVRWGGASRKKRKIAGGKHDKLQQIEDLHVQSWRRGNNHRTTSSESESGSGSGSVDTDLSFDSGDGVASTSEDAVFGEELEAPKFDVTKSGLLATYMNLNKKPKMTALENNVEVEVASEKAMRVGLVDGGTESSKGRNGRGGGGGGGRGGSGSGGEVVKGEEGPRFRDLGGMEGLLEELRMEVIVPLYHPQLPRWLGVRPMAGILLHGPPGCGKTKLAHAIANETGVPFYKISATEVVSGVSGASEENIRDLFSKAYRTAPSIVFIDEIDAIASKRENLQREMERRIVTQLMTCMDDSHRLLHHVDANSNSESSDQRPGYVLVIGATNRPDAVDPALRRPGRFDREIVLGVPDENARVKILSVLTRNLRLEGSFDLFRIARSTPGFVGADLEALANKAGNLAMKRIIDEKRSDLSKDSINEEYIEDWWRQPWLPEEMEKLTIKMADFEEAVKMVQPSLRREGFSSIPNVKWVDVGGLDFLRKDFDRYIVRRIQFPEDYEGFGVDLETGFLLYGPPGCGKTLIAKAVANEAGANFIHIKGPELLNKYVGESEMAVRTLFSRARTCSPCILFFDEVDALTTKRGQEGGWVIERLLNQLLIELDGAEQRRGVFVIGATNRPEMMDPAVLRPGRFGKLLYVPLPSPDERGLILKALGRKKPIDASVDLSAIGKMDGCENLSGADLAALMNEAAMVALEEKQASTERTTDAAPSTITTTHFVQALGKISPSVSDKQKRDYQNLSERLRSA